ncbi:macrolide ABC transporter ATP-binding protein/permease [Rhodoblastus sphagnicola]|uniref:Macrolide ABC transporter ATP-binding protein/permease n=1 Tax=Rhodoblastus sphagnicola TaxID=333368 RepID=A0A2S6N1Y8_9HYPH|nr:ABC transporter permease [Rhodoblastus sphagnicola]PPQ28635.1 macrolide ABC transporter ATP-binding protein/permease [Rhodoblastus sphagnicola]
MEQPVIKLEAVTRTFVVGDLEVRALRAATLTIARGEFLAIMGSSGSGKSTLMAILGCLDRPTSGAYLLDGVDVAGLDEPELARIRSERLGFVFQSFNLLARTSALENVGLPLYYAAAGPVDGATRRARAQKSLEFLGLGAREANMPNQLSGGQQQRVAIARALINAPSLLLADEPTGNLDTKTSHEIMETLTQLNRDQGVTIVLVTHESDIAAYADRLLTMRDGEIISDARTRPTRAPNVVAKAPPPSNRPTVGGFWSFGLMIVAAAVQAIGRNKMRSSLTMLGVFIGVAALIVMVAVGDGANEAVRKQIEGLGANVVVILPGAAHRGGMRGGAGSASTLTLADAAAIRREDAAVAQVGYLIRQQGQAQYANQDWTTTIQGVSLNYPPITNWRIAAGRAFTAEDSVGAELVAIIGQTVARQLFGANETPVGAYIQVKNTPLRVVGVLAAKGQTSFGQDQDDLVMTPFTTAERKVLGAAAPSQTQTPLNWSYLPAPNPYALQARLTGYVNQIYVQAVSAAQVRAAIDQASATLMRRHRIKPGAVKDFDIRNLSQYAETAANSSRIMALLLAAVASISLLVGGIGIMNILLVSVTERTREIGLRMAIGARRLHVLLQFLTEAIILSVSGGLAGIVAGVAIAEIISLGFGWGAPLSLTAVAGGFLFSAAVGVFFGYYPARKASSLDPIEALRYE